MKKSLLLSPKRIITIFNNDFNLWKSKLMDKKKEESKFEDLDQLSEPLSSDFLNESKLTSEVEEEDTSTKPSVNLPGIPNANIGSLSFVGGYPSKFPIANPPSKNATFELPKQNAQGKWFFDIFINRSDTERYDASSNARDGSTFPRLGTNAACRDGRRVPSCCFL